MEKPSEDDLKRDLAADLLLCDAASAGPWMDIGVLSDDAPGHWCRPIQGQNYNMPAHCYGDGPPRRHNAQMIATSREGWPAAIRRAVAAEEQVAQLRDEIRKLRRELGEASDEVDHLVSQVDHLLKRAEPK